MFGFRFGNGDLSARINFPIDKFLKVVNQLGGIDIVHLSEEGKGFIGEDVTTAHDTIGFKYSAGDRVFFNNLFDSIF